MLREKLMPSIDINMPAVARTASSLVVPDLKPAECSSPVRFLPRRLSRRPPTHPQHSC